MTREEVIQKLRERVVHSLPLGWQKGLKCPNESCGSSADRPKCWLDLGGMCPRHDPTNYDPSPFVTKPDPLCQLAADMLEGKKHERV